MKKSILKISLILIVLFLVALFLIVIPEYYERKASGAKYRCEANLYNLRDALYRYKAKVGHYPKGSDRDIFNLLFENGLIGQPQKSCICPSKIKSNNANAYFYDLVCKEDSDYTIKCKVHEIETGRNPHRAENSSASESGEE